MIPVNEPLLEGRELEYVTECVETAWISSAGKYIGAFEEAWAGYCGRRHGVAVSNGTTALQLAVSSLDLEPGDEVILPAFTIVSCALAVVYNRAVPVLVDCDPGTWTMDPAAIEERITERTRAIMAVHIYGHAADMDPILELAERRGLAVIEDAAEAHGAEYLSGRDGAAPRWRRCGGLGTVSTFSFYANKLITTGEGGMVLTDDAQLAERMRSRRNLCFHGGRRFHHEDLGHNFRLTNLQAAIGLAQLERIDRIVERKRWMGHEYTARLRDLEGLQLAPEEPWTRSVFWMYGLVLGAELALDAELCAARLRARGVDTRPFFLGMHEQPVFHRQGLFIGERHPVAERIARRGLYLPSGLALTEAQLAEVCVAVREVVASAREDES